MDSCGEEHGHESEQIIHPAFDELYTKYQHEVFSFACYLTKNRGEAEDLFQEAWLRIIKKLPEKVNMQRIKSWIFTVVINLYRDELRKKRIRRMFLFQKSRAHETGEAFPFLEDESLSDSSNEASQIEIGKDINQALALLPDRQRRVFVLKEIAGFRQAEISEILGVPVGTVKSLMYRAVKRLRQELSKYKSKSNNNEALKCNVKTSSA
ncbi:MAG: sigma-70 family RNA polymerase sigma factor [Candidatus Aminicenantes bacterium]